MQSTELQCDHTSVGVIVRRADGMVALLERARPPIGIAPAAGHVDKHGSVEQAAIDEVREELGVRITPADLAVTSIAERTVNNSCRRPGGTYHRWWVFQAMLPRGRRLHPSRDETNGAAWYDRVSLEGLVARTRAYRAGQLGEEEWQARPGIEPVWLDFLTELGIVVEADT